MGDVTFSPSNMGGKIKAIPSKSYIHRAIVCASLSRGCSVVKNIYYSDDICATIGAFESLNVKFIKKTNKLIIDSKDIFNIKSLPVFDCKDSASTLRFLIPVLGLIGVNSKMILSDSLAQRPMEPYLDTLIKFGMSFRQGKRLSVSGKLNPGKFIVLGNISSQFISGLLMVLPVLNSDSEIEIITKLESKPYIDITVDVMRSFGVKIETTKMGFYISGRQNYTARSYNIEGDFSQTAFFIAGNTISKQSEKLTILGLNKNSLQGDKVICDIINRQGGKVYFDDYNNLIVQPKVLEPIDVDASDVPDLVPVLSVMFSLCKGRSSIRNIGRLKYKESNRLTAIIHMLRSLGVNTGVCDEVLFINGVNKFKPCKINSFNDHRILMASSIAAMAVDGDIRVSDSKCINKSYPDFYSDYKKLGGRAYGINMG